MTLIHGMLFPLAYVGPGLGLGAIAVVLGVMLSVLLAIVSFVWYPVKRAIRAMRGRQDAGCEHPNNDPGA